MSSANEITKNITMFNGEFTNRADGKPIATLGNVTS